MDNLYVYVENQKVDNCIKYGMKLSEFANKVVTFSSQHTKRGVLAYLCPQDCDLYQDTDYTCLRVSIQDDLMGIIYNRVFEQTAITDEFYCDLSAYQYGTFEEPVALICSTILPEYIYIYHKILDAPLLITNSKEYYYQKAISDMLIEEKFTNFELYQMLLILGEQKKLFEISKESDKLKLYTDKKTGKKYTKKVHFISTKEETK